MKTLDSLRTGSRFRLPGALSGPDFTVGIKTNPPYVLQDGHEWKNAWRLDGRILVSTSPHEQPDFFTLDQGASPSRT